MGKKHHNQPPEATGKEEAASSNSRRIYLFGRLENEVVLPVIRRIQRLNDRDSKTPIDLYLNSSGGNGYNADAIIAIMHSISAPVNTICLGHALSGACEILAAGTGERSSYEFATLMFHQTLWEADGDITNLEIQAAQGQRFREAQIELLSRCTGQKKERIRQDIERDHYLSAREALEYGIIDRIIPGAPDRAKSGKSSSSKSSSSKDSPRKSGTTAIPRRGIRSKNGR